MNENKLKTKIFILQAIDTLFVITLTIAAIYSIFYAENKEQMIIMCFVGLFLVNTLGRATTKKVATMRVQIDILKRKMKTEEQRTLMGTRHRTTRVTKTTTTNTKPTVRK